ncbi:MAG TPA: homoserine O-acetyltransferase [Chitinophagaceae bacterium]|nr:homoserine O-acetyltransferase [Chitinophagaceae bacterium]
MSYSIYKSDKSFTLESGHTLPGYHLAYTTLGALNRAKDNVVWIFHALTANSNPEEWWPGLVGYGKFFDPEKYFIVCVNMPGSCYGSIGPLDINSKTGAPFYHDFPFFTTRDMIRSYQPLKDLLGIKKIKIGIGGSMGGQQLLEWAIEEPELFEAIFPIATNATHSAWGVAFNASQRMCIQADSTWKEKNEQAGSEGMKAARSVALISYRSYDTYHASQSESENEKIEHFKSESYQRYQGEKLAKRFNAFSYYFLSKGMDAHNVGRNRLSMENALQQIKAKTLAIGIKTDILFPINEQKLIAEHIPGARFVAISSLYGHDGFLLEAEQLQNLISSFLKASLQKKILNENLK